jgi:hypothetical protein
LRRSSHSTRATIAPCSSSLLRALRQHHAGQCAAAAREHALHAGADERLGGRWRIACRGVAARRKRRSARRQRRKRIAVIIVRRSLHCAYRRHARVLTSVATLLAASQAEAGTRG